MNPPPDQKSLALFRDLLKQSGQLEMAERNGFIKSNAKEVLSHFITNDFETKQMLALVEHLARFDEPVTILGETGCGKEMIAKALHGNREGAFVPFNCTAIPETLVDSILFGHIRGTFTGADTDRTGLIESANGGTLFIDEIGEMPLATQAKLLRVLQDKKIRPVGGLVERPISCRIVCATHRNLWSLVESGAFRQDLFWRICVFEVRIKPLRERREDIREMAHVLDDKHVLSESDYDELCAAPLHGNFRELEALIKRKKLMYELNAKVNKPVTANVNATRVVGMNPA